MSSIASSYLRLQIHPHLPFTLFHTGQISPGMNEDIYSSPSKGLGTGKSAGPREVARFLHTIHTEY